jgi:hypothetical protein
MGRVPAQFKPHFELSMISEVAEDPISGSVRSKTEEMTPDNDVEGRQHV